LQSVQTDKNILIKSRPDTKTIIMHTPYRLYIMDIERRIAHTSSSITNNDELEVRAVSL
jgi:hypothetical protein